MRCIVLFFLLPCILFGINNAFTQEIEGVSKPGSINLERTNTEISGFNIKWQTPSGNYSTTSNENFIVEACITSPSEVKRVIVYVNNKSQKEYGQPKFRSGNCDFPVKETVKLSNGENKIKIVVTNTSNTITSKEVTIKYGFSLTKNYALLIGVETYYDTRITNLDNPVKDAQNLLNALKEDYKFESADITLLKNPTRSDICDALDHLSNVVTSSDNLLIFYAGHGIWDEKEKVGYWLPTDAKVDKRSNWLSNSRLQDYIRGIDSKHTLLISDACFSGSIFKTRSVQLNTILAIQKLDKLPSRKAMTSGTLKSVPDESVFVKFLIARLRENKQKYLPSEQLFFSFKTAVLNNSENIPQFGVIKSVGDEGGDFIFIRR